MASALVAVSAAIAVAAPPPIVVVTEDGVSQFKATAQAVREQIPDAVPVDVSAGDVVAVVRAKRPAVIVAVGGKAAALMKDAIADVPLVYAGVLHPASKGLKGERITGVPMDVPPAVVLPTLKRLAPKVSTVGVLYDPSTTSEVVEASLRVAGELGLTLIANPVRSPREVRGTVEQMASKIDALWLVPDPRIMTQEVVTYLALFATERRIPAVGFLEQMTSLGLVISIAPDFVDIGRRAGQLAKEIAQRPADKRLPVRPPVFSSGELSINQRAAGQLGISIPASLLSQAKKVVR